MNHVFIKLLGIIVIAGALFLFQSSLARADESQYEIIAVAIPSTPQTPIVSVPILLLADPGMAYVMSTPFRQLQVRIEGETASCGDKLLQTDDSGIAELTIASTHRCLRPRLVVFH